MQMLRKTMAIILTTILALSTTALFVAIPTASAYNSATQTAIDQGMYWKGMGPDASANRLILWNRFHDKIPTYTYMIIAPNPVGVGQRFNVVMFNPQVPPAALLGNPIRYQFKMTVVKPDGTVENLPSASSTTSLNVGGGEGGISGGVFVSDSTGSTYMAYTPDQVGNYTLTCYFLELQYLWNSTNGGGSGSNDYYGTTFLASNYTSTVTVQQESVNLVGLPILQPLPTEYWTRPIEGQNTEWYKVSSNWLSGPHDRDNGGGENRYQAEGIAPNSAHILWTRPTEDNGIIGGDNDGRGGGNAFNAGSQYQPRFTNQIIMYGRLYYSPNVIASGSSNYMDCVDLRTGELLWEVDTKGENVAGLLGVSTTANMPQFGYYYSQDDPNEHGIQNPGWLFTSNYGIGYQPERGLPWLNIFNVPAASYYGGGPASVFEIQNPQSGENLRYVITNQGTSSNPNYYLAQWNSSKVIPMISAGGNPTNLPIPGNVPITPGPSGSNNNWNGSMWVTSSVRTAQGYASVSRPSFDWNVTMPWQFTTTPTVRAAKLGDILWGSNGSWPTGTSGPSYAYPDEVTIWAVSLKPGSYGQAIYMRNLDIDDANINTNNMFERADANSGVFVTLEVPICRFHVYDMYTGNEMFTTDKQTDDLNPYGYFTWPSLISATQTKLAYGMLYTAGYTGSVSAYNLTTGKLQWRQTYPSGGEKINNYVQMEALICDGKIFVGTHEHSADTPLYKGERIHALNAYTGEEVWGLAGWAYPMTFATADGILIFWNNYDAQIYAIGKGPSATTVTAPNVAAPLDTPVVIRGTVTDISAGTRQKEQAARFPNGVPAVSDASMSQWMEYVYMQKGRPSNTTGVTVTLSVIDSNGNYRDIGTATSDASGMFTYTWKPDIEGDYTVIASFAGSESYWPSYAESSFTVTAAASTATPPAPVVSLPPTEIYFIGSTVAIVIAIAIATLLIIRKRP